MTAMFLARRTAMGAALGFAVALSYFLPAIPLLIDVGAPLVESARTIIGNDLTSAMLLAFLLTLSTHWARGPMARVAAAVLIIASIVAFKLVMASFTSIGWFENNGAQSARGAAIFGMWHVIAVGTILAVYFDQVRRVQASTVRLRSAQIERQRVERDVIQSRLNVMRARVDPMFLFESLGEVRRAYGGDADAAEGLLDDLIRFLRASLPGSHDRGSTLGDEIDLAAAYLKVVSVLRGRAFHLRVEIPDALRLAFFPPMVLLPLVDDALRRARAESPREASIVVRGTIDNGAARVVVEDGADATIAAPLDLEALRTTMRAFMGEARVASRADRAGCSVALEYPMRAPLVAERKAA
jgi:hypothetical protein